MTADAVIRASNGTVSPFTPKARLEHSAGVKTEVDKAQEKAQDERPSPGAQGQYEAGDFVFVATFSFDRKTSGLAEVSLSLKEPLVRGDDLRRALISQYGPGLVEKSRGLRTTVWLDKPQQNHVELVELEIAGSLFVRVKYTPLKTAATGKL